MEKGCTACNSEHHYTYNCPFINSIDEIRKMPFCWDDNSEFEDQPEVDEAADTMDIKIQGILRWLRNNQVRYEPSLHCIVSVSSGLPYNGFVPLGVLQHYKISTIATVGDEPLDEFDDVEEKTIRWLDEYNLDYDDTHDIIRHIGSGVPYRGALPNFVCEYYGWERKRVSDKPNTAVEKWLLKNNLYYNTESHVFVNPDTNVVYTGEVPSYVLACYEGYNNRGIWDEEISIDYGITDELFDNTVILLETKCQDDSDYTFGNWLRDREVYFNPLDKSIRYKTSGEEYKIGLPNWVFQIIYDFDNEIKTAQPNGATKADGEKIQLELCMPIAIAALGRVLTYGATKYDAWNWAKGFRWMRVLGSLLRHLLLFWAGQDRDEESGLPHVDHIMFNASVLCHFYYTGDGTDDRPEKFHQITGLTELLTMVPPEVMEAAKKNKVDTNQ